MRQIPHLFLSLLFLVLAFTANAQVKIGNNSTTINSGSLLELESTNKGILLPRVALSDTSTWALSGTPTDGMLVYNTATVAGQLAPGIYIYNSSKWKLITTTTGTKATNWTSTGNSGTTDGVNFIGTTDNVPLNFKVNNQVAGRVDSSASNTFLGYKSGKALTSGTALTGFGKEALSANTTGINNTAVGSTALKFNVTGNRNTAVGSTALFANSSGSDNVAIGMGVLAATTSSTDNVGVGSLCLASNNSGTGNTAIGKSAMNLNSTGSSNIAMGKSALFNLTSGNGNSVIGTSAFQATTTGGFNVGLGFEAGAQNISGKNNVFIGDSSGRSNVTGNNNTLIGYKTTVNSAALTNATAIGSLARVDANNALVLGAIAGINGSLANTNVGIGTNSPITLLHVKNGASGVSSYSGSPITVESNFDATIGFATSSFSGAVSGLKFDVSGSCVTNASILYNTSFNRKGFTFTTNRACFLATNAVAMILDSVGRLGLNTLTPTEFIDVNGKVKFVNLQVTNGAALNKVLVSDASGNATWTDMTTAQSNAWGESGNTGTSASTATLGSTINHNYMGTADNHDLVFATNAKERMRIDSIGFVSIGSKSPVSPQTNAGLILTTTNTGTSLGGLQFNAIGTSSAHIDYLRANGTETAPTILTNGIPIVRNLYQGYSGSGFLQAAEMSVMVDTTITTGQMAAAFVFSTKPLTGFSTERMRIDHNGNIGVGMSAPASLLHLDNGLATSNYTKFTASTTTGFTVNDGFDIGINSTGTAEIRQRENLDLDFYTNNTKFMTLDNTGLLGVGIAAPTSKVHIDNGTATATYTKFTANATTGTTATDGFDIGISNTGVAEIRQRENTDMDFFTNNIRRMTIDNAGWVGIGTFTPLAPIHYFGGNSGATANSSASLYLEKSSNNYIQLATTTTTEAGIIHSNSNSNVKSAIIFSANGDIKLRSGGSNTRIFIDSTGKVGINNLTPLAQLDVNGSFAISPNATNNITTDNQLVTVGNESYLRISSNNTTASSRTITLSNGLVAGHHLIIECFSNNIEVADNAGTNNTNTTITHAMGVGDVIEMIWNGSDWLELAFSDN